MTFGQAVRTCLREKYATFQGRASRSEYWWFMLFYMLVVFVLAFVIVLIGSMLASDSEGGSGGAFILVVIPILALFLPVLSVTIRRIHDLGYSGWWYLAYAVLSAIPYLGVLVAIAGIVFACMRGTVGPNQFGEDPLDPHGNLQEVFN